MYVCVCNALTDSQVREARTRGATNVAHVFRSTGSKPECGKCVHCVRDILREGPQLTAVEKTG